MTIPRPNKNIQDK